MANSQTELLTREAELDAGGRPHLFRWMAEGKSWESYPTGYQDDQGKMSPFGALRPEQRHELFEAHDKPARHHREMAGRYLQYENGAPDGPAKIGM
jgi:hypothetical protein